MKNDNFNLIFSPSLSPANISQIIMEKYKDSPVIKEMITADNYYGCHNEEIERKTRNYYDREGNAIENPAANNARIKSNFLRTLVQQKQDYGFAKTFILKLSTDREEDIDLKTNAYGFEWKKFCDEQLYKMSYALAGQAINHGISWCFIWIDENGKLRVKDIPATLIYPVWKDREHTNLDRLVYHYFTESYEDLSPTITEYAEYWSDSERILFDVSNGYIEVPIYQDIEGFPLRSHMINGDNEPISWGKIPLVALKGNEDEKTLLSFIKEQIDAYDLLDSRSIDGLIDDLDPVLVLKNISPSVKDIIEARELVKMTRTMSVDADGDAFYIQAQTSIKANMDKMEGLRRDIMKFGYGVDYQDIRFDGNPNQMVVQTLYQNLDTYTDGIERQFQNFIDNLKYFFDKWYEYSGKGSFEEAQSYRVLVQLDRSMMINESALIDTTARLIDTGVSKRTVLEYNPVVQDVELEEQRLAEESKDEDLFNFRQDNIEDEEDSSEED